jgi:hypothetical protein
LWTGEIEAWGRIQKAQTPRPTLIMAPAIRWRDLFGFMNSWAPLIHEPRCGSCDS